MKDRIDILINIILAIITTIAALFSWRSVKISEKTVAISLFNEMQKTYQSNLNFQANKQAWDLYQKFPEYQNRKPISQEDAMRFVQTTDRGSSDWKAVHDLTLFWRHASFLVRKGYIEEEIVFESFTSPAILRLLYPIENAFLLFHGEDIDYNRSLQRLYNLWEDYKKKS